MRGPFAEPTPHPAPSAQRDPARAMRRRQAIHHIPASTGARNAHDVCCPLIGFGAVHFRARPLYVHVAAVAVSSAVTTRWRQGVTDAKSMGVYVGFRVRSSRFPALWWRS